MWKIAVGFAVFAALALFILSKGGDIDMGGEKHGAEAMHVPEAAAPASAPASASTYSRPWGQNPQDPMFACGKLICLKCLASTGKTSRHATRSHPHSRRSPAQSQKH